MGATSFDRIASAIRFVWDPLIRAYASRRFIYHTQGRKILSRLLGLTTFTLAAACAATPAPAPQQIEMMIIGTYHFANNNRDVFNVRSDDVLSTSRKHELAVLAERIAQWKPTKILVEVEPTAEGQRLTGENGEFDQAMLSTVANERVQIGYRVAALVRAPVFAINEQPDADEPDYFPFGKVADFANNNGMSGGLQALLNESERDTTATTTSLGERSIPSVLASLNSDAAVDNAHAAYLKMLRFGDLRDQPGAELYAYWMMRNAKIFAKAMLVTNPGDRVLIVYGSGHAYWLRHFAAQMPGYRMVSPFSLLSGAADALRDSKSSPRM